MIYLNSRIDTLNIAPSKYDISCEGAILHMIENNRFMEAINKAIDLDYEALKEESNIDALKNSFNSKSFFSLIIKLIDALVGIIVKGVKIIIGITKKFLYRSSEVNKSNADFLNKYKDALNNIASVSVTMDSYKINDNLNNISIAIENLSDGFFAEAKGLIMDGKSVFADRHDMVLKLADNRYDILSNFGYGADVDALASDRKWRSEIEFACFGKKFKQTCSVYDALNVINGYDKNRKFVENLSARVKKKCDNDIADLNRLKSLIKGKSLYSNDKELIEQFKLLNTYRTQTMNDLVYTYEVLLKYIDTINTQAKSFCIKALQEN